MEIDDKIYLIFIFSLVLVFNHDFFMYSVAQKSKPVNEITFLHQINVLFNIIILSVGISFY